MPNEVLFFIEAFVVFGALLLIKKFLGKAGLMAWVPVAVILANIQVLESVNVFGLDATLGNVLFASSFLATDMLSENYGKKYAKRAVKAGVIFMLFFIVVSQITLLFAPASFDVARPAIEGVFTLSLRTTAASLLMYALANILDVVLFERLKKATKGKYLWMRNNVCTIVCNCVENFGFVLLAFTGILAFNDMMAIALSTCVIEIVLALLDTPFVYAAKHLKTKNE